MLLPIYPFLLFLPSSFFVARAVPISTDPSLNLIPASNLSTLSFPPASSLFDNSQANALALLLNSTAHNDVPFYRVPNTHTILRLALQDQQIPKANLARTILRTQQSLSAFITAHDAADEPLATADDPYESSPRFQGCFFGVTSFPIGGRHLTYGIVGNVLQGLWVYLFREGRFQVALFEVRDDQFGSVGVGKVTVERPPDDGEGVRGE